MSVLNILREVQLRTGCRVTKGPNLPDASEIHADTLNFHARLNHATNADALFFWNVAESSWDGLLPSTVESGDIQIIPYAATYAPDLTLGSSMVITLSGDMTINKATGGVLGKEYMFIFLTTGGNHLVTWGDVAADYQAVHASRQDPTRLYGDAPNYHAFEFVCVDATVGSNSLLRVNQAEQHSDASTTGASGTTTPLLFRVSNVHLTATAAFTLDSPFNCRIQQNPQVSANRPIVLEVLASGADRTMSFNANWLDQYGNAMGDIVIPSGVTYDIVFMGREGVVAGGAQAKFMPGPSSGGALIVETSATTLNAISGRHHLVDTSSNVCTVTLPDTPAKGTVIWIHESGGNAANDITVDTAGSDTINGVATKGLEAAYQGGHFIYDDTNTNWIASEPVVLA